MFVHKPYVEADLSRLTYLSASGQGRQVKIPNPYNQKRDCLLTFVTGRRTSYYSHRYAPTHTGVFNYRKVAMRQIFNMQTDNITRLHNCSAIVE